MTPASRRIAWVAGAVALGTILALGASVLSRSRADQSAAKFELEAHGADHHAEITELRREVARLTSVLERSRAQIALSRRAVIPQANSATLSATASYRAGRGEFVGLLTTMRSTYSAETQYIRALQEFAVTLAELESLAGGEVLR